MGVRGTHALLGARFLLLFRVQPSCLSFVEHLFPDPPLCHNYVHCFHLTVPTVCVTVLHWLVIVVKIPNMRSAVLKNSSAQYNVANSRYYVLDI